jgi:hypothetical protein
VMRFFKIFLFSYIISPEGIYLLNNCFKFLHSFWDNYANHGDIFSSHSVG